MAKMTQAQMREEAKKLALKEIQLSKYFEPAGKDAFSVPVMVNDTEIWVEVKMTAKNWYETKKRSGEVTPPYDPFEREREWQEILSDREKAKQQREERKAKKIAKSKGQD